MSRPRRALACRFRLETLDDRITPATITVTGAGDTVAVDGVVTLREALASVNAGAGVNADVAAVGAYGTNDQVVFAPQLIGQTITLGGTALPDLSRSVTIAGPGAASLTISGNNQSGILGVLGGATVTVSGLTLAAGNTQGNGGGINNLGTLTVVGCVVTNCLAPVASPTAGHGGGIFNQGALTVADSTVGNGVAANQGGGIYNGLVGTLAVLGTTVSGSSSNGGGGIYNLGVMTVINSTVAGNTAADVGAGILSESTQAVTIVNATVAANIAGGTGAGLATVSADNVLLLNTIVAGNADKGTAFADLSGTVRADSSFNLIGQGGNLTNGVNGNIVGVTDAKLGPLANNGGPTQTMALLPGSPAIDAGSNANVPAGVTTDQRRTGFPRIVNGTVDIGAFEAGTPIPPPPSPPPPPGTVPPQQAVAGGSLDGTGKVLLPSGGQYVVGSVLPFFPGVAVDVRTATADVNGDGVPDYVAGAGPGGSPRVTVLDGKTGGRLADFLAFEASFTGGVFVAAADLTGDGRAEVVVSPDRGGGPIVAVYDGVKLAAGLAGDAAQLTRFFGIADPAFRGGARPALGDVSGDGTPDLVVSAGFLGGPRIAVFDGRDLAAGSADPRKLVPDFFAFENTLRNGAFVAVGDVTGDGFADIAFGGGPNGAPRVRLFDGKALLAAAPFTSLDDIGSAQRANFFAGDPSLRGGVRLALRDADGDGRADLLTGSGEGEPSAVRLYRSGTLLAGGSPAADQTLDPFGSVLADGVFVG
jgi:hypothetical protein